MSFKAELEKFDGPLDLMLHLIKNNKLDIFDLDINVLIEQYLSYIKNLKTLKLEIEAEYLFEISTLIEYKSKKLLPKQDEELSDEYEEDPKEKLVKRLIEYQKFKEVSKELFLRFEARQKQLSKPISNYDFSEKEQLQPVDGSPVDLLKAMNRVLRRMSLNVNIDTKITEKELSVDERSNQIKRRLIDLPEVFKLELLLDDCDDINLIVITFLSILDLIRNKILNFKIKDEMIWFNKGGVENE